MTEWSVILTHAIDEGIDPEAIADLFGDETTVSFAPGEVSAAFDIEAPTAAVAVDLADERIEKVFAGPSSPLGELLEADVMSWERREAQALAPNFPDIVSAPEVAQILNVSRQRVHQLISENQSFPPPIVRLGSGPLWLRSTIEAWNRTWARKPGRPRVSDAVKAQHAMIVQDVRKASRG